MNATYLMFVILAFLAVVLVLEGLYHTFFAGRSREARRIRHRLSQLNDVGRSIELKITREEEHTRLSELARWLMERAWGRRLTLYVHQADAGLYAADMVLISGALLLAGVLAAALTDKPLSFGAAVGSALAAAPWWFITYRRDKRIQKLEQQFPEALDMIARAMRAGHALTLAIKMCGDELPGPLGPELREMSDEITLGIAFTDALHGLVERVPLRDVTFLAVALTVQRETGGNLAELLDKLARLMRERFKVIGDIRIKSAEGRMSAWILGLLPFGMAAILMYLNPQAVSLLWTDPSGRAWLTRMLVLMAVGIFWITRIVRIRA
ncbi:type II secretion system F family protein [Aquabacterium sp.]|uniref:type II secretion system F family protein n=1 Tax=Aquabacterium sp. TaxID=1872578 RepID=UPI0040380869